MTVVLRTDQHASEGDKDWQHAMIILKLWMKNMFGSPSNRSEEKFQSQDDEKKSLEIEKIQLEIKYIRRNFAFQSLNAISLISITIIIFYFFQRPQIDILQANGLNAEKQHVANMMINIQQIKEIDVRRKLINALYEQWPQYDFIKKILDSEDLIAAEGENSENNTRNLPRVVCLEYSDRIVELDKQIKTLTEQYTIEIKGSRQFRTMGIGAAASAIRSQIKSLEKEKMNTREQLDGVSCNFVQP